MQLVNTFACHAKDRGFEPRRNRHYGFIAQSVEQGTENPCVAGSIPAGATIFYSRCYQRFFNIFIILLTFIAIDGKFNFADMCVLDVLFIAKH